MLIALAGFLALQTMLWLGARERIDGTVVAVERGGHAVVEGQAADGRIVRAVDATSVRPPPLVGSPASLAVKPGSRYGATVVGFMNTWFLPVLFGAIGLPFATIGLLALLLGTRRQIVGNAPAAQGWSEPSPGTGSGDEITVVNNYYGDDGTYQA